MQEKNTREGRKLTFTVSKKPQRHIWVDEEHRLLALDFRLVKKPLTGEGFVRGDRKKFPTPYHLKVRCDEYFASCYGAEKDRKGNLIRDDDGKPVVSQLRPFTISGLARHLGVKTSLLKRYHDGVYDDPGFDVSDEQFSTVLDNAIQKVEQYVEEQLYSKDTSFGAKFCLTTAFSWTTPKEVAEINSLITQGELKKAEFALKKAILEASKDDDDTELKIQIIRASKD